MRWCIFLFLFLLMPLFSLSADDASNNICIFAVPKALVTLPDISVGSVKDGALKLVKAVPDKVDELTFTLADKLESTKKSPNPPLDGGLTSVMKDDSQVLGASSGSAKSSKSNLTASAYNAGVDAVGILLRHWMWSLSGLGALALFWTFKA